MESSEHARKAAEAILERLCIYDERNPNRLDPIDPDEPTPPRDNCGCDNCDALALEVLAERARADRYADALKIIASGFPPEGFTTFAAACERFEEIARSALAGGGAPK